MVYDQKIADEHVKRMFEPEEMKKLRRQLDEIDEADKRDRQRQEADRLRDEIRRRGHKPCA